MDTARQGPKPDETDTSAVGDRPDAPDQTKAEITESDAGKVTASRRPSKAEDGPAKPEQAAEKYVLEREPDGRYRIVGRRPQKQK